MKFVIVTAAVLVTLAGALPKDPKVETRQDDCCDAWSLCCDISDCSYSYDNCISHCNCTGPDGAQCFGCLAGCAVACN